MTQQAIVNTLVQYRLLDEQIKELEVKKSTLKKEIESHMKANNLETMEENGIYVSYVPRNVYSFDLENIVKYLPEVIKYAKITNETFEKFLVGHEQLIGNCRKLEKQEKTLTIRLSKKEEK